MANVLEFAKSLFKGRLTDQIVIRDPYLKTYRYLIIV